MKRRKQIGKAHRLYVIFYRTWDGDRTFDSRKRDFGCGGRSFSAVGLSPFLSLGLIIQEISIEIRQKNTPVFTGVYVLLCSFYFTGS